MRLAPFLTPPLLKFELHNKYFDVTGKVKDKDWFTVSGKGSVELRHKEGIVAIDEGKSQERKSRTEASLTPFLRRKRCSLVAALVGLFMFRV